MKFIYLWNIQYVAHVQVVLFDYALLYKDFPAVAVIQAKLSEHIDTVVGQLAATMQTAREDFAMQVLHQSKHQVKALSALKHVHSFSHGKYTVNALVVRNRPYQLSLTCAITHALYYYYMPLPIYIVKIPSYGVVTNGLKYRLYKYDASTRRLINSRMFMVDLHEGISPANAQKAVTPIFGRLVHIVTEQKAALHTLHTEPDP
eukprot:21373-Heterococcus_DN1.PRE.3